MRVRTLTALATAAVAACAIPAAVPASASPAELLASILAAGRAERSVHYTGSTDYGLVPNHGRIVMSQVGDAGSSIGRQLITFRQNGRAGHVTVIADAASAYIRGDVFSLRNYVGLKASAASKYAGKWIAIPDTSGAYATVAAGVRLVSTIHDLTLSGSLTRAPSTTIAGQKVVGVRGHVTSLQGKRLVLTLYGRATGPPLPVEEVSLVSHVTFSKWNEPLRLATPRDAVSIAVVLKTP